MEEEIKEAIIRLGLSNNINMLGHQKNVRTYLENASVFLLPSISEGLSIATIEAQAMGLPCVVSDSVPSEVNCGLCKFMSLNDPPQEWAHQIDVLATGKEKLTIDIERLNRFEVSKTLRQLQEIYE